MQDSRYNGTYGCVIQYFVEMKATQKENRDNSKLNTKIEEPTDDEIMIRKRHRDDDDSHQTTTTTTTPTRSRRHERSGEVPTASCSIIHLMQPPGLLLPCLELEHPKSTRPSLRLLTTVISVTIIIFLLGILTRILCIGSMDPRIHYFGKPSS